MAVHSIVFVAKVVQGVVGIVCLLGQDFGLSVYEGICDTVILSREQEKENKFEMCNTVMSN